METFFDSYKAKFEKRFENKEISPTKYLIQQTLERSDKQLCLIDSLNPKLVLKNFDRPFTEQNLESEQKFNFSNFKTGRKSDTNKLAKSKSSQQLMHLGDNSIGNEGFETLRERDSDQL